MPLPGAGGRCVPLAADGTFVYYLDVGRRTPMTLAEALALLPDQSPYRVVLAGMTSADPEERRAGEKALQSLRKPYWEKVTPLEESVALAVLRATLELGFPPPANEWDRGAAGIVFTLVGSAHPSVVELVEARFADAEPSLRLDLLTVVASAATRRGAEVLASLVRRHGWPSRFYARFFVELGKNVAHADALFPALLEVPDGPAIEIGDLLLRSLRSAALPSARVEGAPMVRDLSPRIEALIAKQSGLRGRNRGDLQDADLNVERELAMLLDLAGFVGGPAILGMLRAAAELPEAWPAAFAVTSMLRRGEEVSPAAFARIAGDHATRAAFYALLRDVGATSRIPSALRDRDAFAAADMVQWLSHPGELGHPPDAIEKMAVFEARRGEEQVVLYVWRFRDGAEPWKAAVSGAYPADAPEGPLHGSDTFSRFEAWDSKSPEKHAAAILRTLGEWRRAWAAGDRSV